MPATGHYSVRLRANQLYQVALMAGRCHVETQEFGVPATAVDSGLVKNFYLGPWEGTEEERLNRNKECFPEQ